ncbi:hypothetical protein B0H10DRAFT_1954552 [Mycena sp. CBHHK59/15]|nr:hypothetical protein B0H10DRAFT_1954552 [Mycena sp. CBHHK59/15]
MQNFKHNEDVDVVFSLIHAISLRDYRELSKHFTLRSAPLSLSVDDTKLFLPLQPLYNGVKGKWYIIGTLGSHRDSELATKLQLWFLQISLPGVPPLVSPIIPIGSKVKAAELAEWQLKLMNRLISRGFRITSRGGDGASVECDCQRKTAGR